MIEGIDENIIRRLRGSFSPSIAWIYPKTNSDPIVLRAEREREREELYKQDPPYEKLSPHICCNNQQFSGLDQMLNDRYLAI